MFTFSEITKPQKTLILCSVFIAGTGVLLGGGLPYLFTTIAVLTCLLLFLFNKRVLSARFALLCLAIFAFALFYAEFRKPEPDGLYSFAPTELSLRGQVISEPQNTASNKTKFHFNVKSFKYESKWTYINAKTIVYIKDKERKFKEIKIGNLLELHGSVNPPFHATNPGQFDYGKYLNHKGIFTMTFVKDNNYKILEDSNSGKWHFINSLNAIKEKITSIHAKNLESPNLELLGGMVFGGCASPTPKNVEEAFIKSGLLHLLAASGLNVGIIFGIWFFLASKLGMPYKPKIITGMLLVAFYSLLTGLPPSVTRAALMMEFILFAKLIDRTSDNAILLIIICALMLLVDPLMINNVGFQLSFVVTLGLLMFIPLLVEEAKPIPEFLSGAFFVPFIAQLFAAPLQIYHFNNFAIYALLANITVLPFVGIISFAGFIGSIFGLIPVIGEKICFISDKIAEPFLFLLLFISEYTATLPEAIQYLPKIEPIGIMLFYLLFLSLFISIKNKFSVKKCNIASLIIVLILFVFLFKGNLNKNLEFIFFDVGQGDSILIKTPQNKYILVDTGPNGDYSPANTAIVPYLRDKGIKTLDILLLTHPDFDHTGGAVNILKNIKTEKIYTNGVVNKTKTYRILQKYFQQNNLKPDVLVDGDEINLDSTLKITVIRPDNINIKDDNEDSLMLYIVYKNFSALLMADCEANSLKLLKKHIKKPVDLLKVGHHGSYNSVNNNFMEYIKPEISIISVGERGYAMKLPNHKVIKLLEKFNSVVLRTDRDFAIKISTDGQKTNYKTFKNSDF
ncbi:MAG TPA: DNA internalization-related competence protein ComEC/Rec2 [Candidatus Gastranaerophilales bacterium]|nr:DNA internalization-related competence protein ComEC/Rec2 [Candidatus Gastranaerophilales bacterium]